LLGAASAHAEPRGGVSRVIMMIGGVASDRTDDKPIRDEAVSNAYENAYDSVSRVLQFEAPQAGAGVTEKVMALFPLIEEAARALDIDSALLMAVVDVESGGDPRALSAQGAAGLMQLMPATGRLYGAADRFDAQQNIAAGARFLRRLLTRFGNLDLALAAYNAGEDAVRRFNGSIPPYRETRQYVPRVIERYRRYQQAVLTLRAQQVLVESDAAHSGAHPGAHLGAPAVLEAADTPTRRR
jgi:soluble lytic murein transglycosylase-like protein